MVGISILSTDSKKFSKARYKILQISENIRALSFLGYIAPPGVMFGNSNILSSNSLIDFEKIIDECYVCYIYTLLQHLNKKLLISRFEPWVYELNNIQSYNSNRQLLQLFYIKFINKTKRTTTPNAFTKIIFEIFKSVLIDIHQNFKENILYFFIFQRWWEINLYY